MDTLKHPRGWKAANAEFCVGRGGVAVGYADKAPFRCALSERLVSLFGSVFGPAPIGATSAQKLFYHRCLLPFALRIKPGLETGKVLAPF